MMSQIRLNKMFDISGLMGLSVLTTTGSARASEMIGDDPSLTLTSALRVCWSG